MSPDTFQRVGIKSAVTNQPSTEGEKLLAYAAMVACPVGSIRTRTPDALAAEASAAFPSEIDPVHIPGIMHMGYHSLETYGATPYFIQRPEALGNVMIDVPRFNSRLANQVDAEGGVR